MPINDAIQHDLERMNESELAALHDRAEHFGWRAIVALCAREAESRAARQVAA